MKGLACLRAFHKLVEDGAAERDRRPSTIGPGHVMVGGKRFGEGRMEPFTVIATALITGAAAGGTEAASMAVRDAYAALRDRLSGGGADSAALTVIEANEAAPGTNIVELETTLEQRGVLNDDEVRAAAEALLMRLPSDQIDHARRRIDVRDAQGVQVGDYNTQHNTFS